MNKIKRFNSIGYLILLLLNWHICSAEVNTTGISVLPGASPFTSDLQRKLETALRNKGKNYQPRSQQLHADGSPKYTNRLLLEPSPYLQQHSHNPVNWYPWGEEAFDQAKKLNRPVLVSVGYSTCHWCHVMEEESYDNPEIAEYINSHFIAIKVDRESRPDIDAIYMRAVQTMTGHGGWPLNVWLLPNKQAFFGGTYFPPQDKQGRKGLMTVLQSINTAYHQESASISNYANKLTKAIQGNIGDSGAMANTDLNYKPIKNTAHYFKKNIDPFSGGLGDNVKFPSSTPIRLLLRQYQHKPDQQLLEKIQLTLDKMAAGGIYDQIGGGFHRYSTDPQWRVPHFEKMLYDNARLTMDYLEAYQLTKDPNYQRIVTETLDYVLREMTSPEGGFYSATDADSLNERNEMEEGWYFTWTPEELSKILNIAQLPLVSDWFGITAQGELEGRNVLFRPQKTEEFTLKKEISPAALSELLNNAKTALLQARAKRKPPLRDDKIITAWNGLMIASFAKAGFVLNRPDYLAAARKAADFLLTTLFTSNRLQRIYLNGNTQGPAFLNDYAFFIDALLELYQADTQPRWLQQAIKLQKQQDELYLDHSDGIYFKTAHDSEKLLVRDKPDQDRVLPSGNSIAAYNLLRLYKLTTDEVYFKKAIRLIKAMQQRFEQRPLSMTDMLISLDFALSNGKEVVLVIAEQADNTQAMRKIMRDTYIPEHVYLVVNEGDSLKANAAVSLLLEAKRAMKGKTTAYVCKDKVCKLPTNDPEVFAGQLQ